MEIPDACFEWRNPLALPPLTAFDLPRNHERPPRTALGKYVFQGVQGSRMAGHLLKPTFVEFCEWCQMDGLDRTSNKSGYIVELLIQMYPVERKTFVANSGVTTYEFARTYRDCGITARRAAFWLFAYTKQGFPKWLTKSLPQWDDDWYLPIIDAKTLAKLEGTIV